MFVDKPGFEDCSESLRECFLRQLKNELNSYNTSSEKSLRRKLTKRFE